MIRVLVVDDEPLAREVLANLLAAQEGVELVGQCKSGREAVVAIQEQAPDLVFLDIQMPGMDGFGVIRAIGAEHMPLVVFVTAFDEFALRAFEVHAVDYLLKPFTDDRFLRALEHARAWLRTHERGEFGRKLMKLVAQNRELLGDAGAAAVGGGQGLPGGGPARWLQRLTIKSAGSVYFLDVDEIDWIEAANNCVKLHCGERSHLMRATISSIEAQLDPTQFVRIHRSTVVRTDRIRRLRPQEHGDYQVLLRDGTELRMSRRRREELRARLPL